MLIVDCNETRVAYCAKLAQGGCKQEGHRGLILVAKDRESQYELVEEIRRDGVYGWSSSLPLQISIHEFSILEDMEGWIRKMNEIGCLRVKEVELVCDEDKVTMRMDSIIRKVLETVEG